VRALSQRLDDAQFTRNPALPGAELRVVNGQREWGFFSQDYQIVFSEDWIGKIWHQRAEVLFGPRAVVVAAPSQLVLAKKSTPGNLLSLSIDKTLAARLVEGTAAGTLATGHLVISDAEATLLAEFVRALQLCQCPLTLEALLVELVVALARPATADDEASAECAQKVNHPFGAEDEIAFDLRSLSEQLGTSRFSALRAFKRHFGLPPHNYQIHLRVEQAQSGLRAGQSPARVAVDCGFFDQSHMTRHFKRVLGTTPAQYARSWLPALVVGVAPAIAQAQPQ
jgi:AraC-like DNA-binding protein